MLLSRAETRANPVLAYHSLTHVYDAMRRGLLSPVDLLRAQRQQMHLWQPNVNALTARFDDAAFSSAQRALHRFERGLAGSLEGIALAIKDETYIDGQITTNGSLLLRDNIAKGTDPVPQRLIDAGGYVHVRTTTPEFSCAGYTWSTLWGVSRNPWNTAITCGGSSGGSAIALATGMTCLANGSDAGGSIRIPAAMCGLYGYKAPHGRIPEVAPYSWEPYCHHGIMTRTLDDLLAVLPLIRVRDARDLHSFLPDQNPALIPEKALQKIRIAVSADLGFFTVEHDIVAALQHTVDVLRKAGLVVEFVSLPWDERVIQTAKVHQWAMLGQLIKRQFSKQPYRAQLTSYAQHYLQGAEALTIDDVVDANLYAVTMWEALASVFHSFDVLLCPTMASNSIPADFDYSRDSCVINGKQVDANKGWFMTYPFNTLSQCPVLAMPNGFSQNGVPTSVQIVGRPYQESLVFEVARHLSTTVAGDFFTKHFPCLPEHNRCERA